MMKILLSLNLWLLALTSLPLTGETIAVRALAIGDFKSTPSVYLSTANGFTPLSLSRRQPSAHTLACCRENLLLFEEIDSPGMPATYKVVQELKLPENAKNVLILAYPSDGVNSYWVIRDEYPQASPNEWLVINTSSQSVMLEAGEDEKSTVVIKAKESRVWTIEEDFEKGFPVTAHADFDGKNKKFYSTFWQFREHERSIVILSEMGNKLKLSKISDRLIEPGGDAEKLHKKTGSM